MSSKFPFPEVIDSSMMSSWKSCRRKFFHAYLQHYKPNYQSIHLHAGKAYASALERARVAFFAEGKSPEFAVDEAKEVLVAEYGDFECPTDSAKSLDRMIGAIDHYFSVWPLESDPATPIVLPSGKRGVEFGFAEPLDVLHPVTGNPLIYSGRMDTVVDYAGGIFGEDDKTASQLGPSWVKQWDLRSQFTGYVWGAGRAGIKLNGFLVRGISILKKTYGSAEALTYRPQWMVDRWYENTVWQLEEMKRAWEKDFWPTQEDFSCNEYSGCEFKPVCLAQDPQPWLDTNFIRRRWNPIERVEEILS